MTKKSKVLMAGAIGTSALTISFLIKIPLQHQSSQSLTAPDICPVSAFVEGGRDNTTPTKNKTLVGEETAEISTQSEDFPEPVIAETSLPQPVEKEKMDIPSTESTKTATNPIAEIVPEPSIPQVGDTRVVNGQKQVYFLGFGWIDDNDEPDECIYAEDMYENRNKIGSMGGGTLVDGDGDINKLVGIMD